MITKTIVLIGLMGCGKSSIGKRLAKELHMPFVDADDEIEKNVGCRISEIFKYNGEPYFREVEQRVIEELLEHGPIILATGGGAYMNPAIRDSIKKHAVSVWLKAEFEMLYDRVSRKQHRPLLEKGNKKEILRSLMEERYPIYADADITVQSTDSPHSRVVQDIIQAVSNLEEV